MCLIFRILQYKFIFNDPNVEEEKNDSYDVNEYFLFII